MTETYAENRYDNFEKEGNYMNNFETLNTENRYNNFEKEGNYMNRFDTLYAEDLTMDKNFVEISGTIVRKYVPSNGKVVFLTVKIPSGNRANFVEIVCVGENKIKAMQQVEEGSLVYVNGNIQSFYKSRGGESYSIMCDFILADEELNDEFFVPNRNRMSICGEVQEVHKCFNLHKLMIRTRVNGHTSVVPVVLYGEERELDFEPGDRATAFGMVQSDKKINALGVKRFYTNYVAFKIEKERCAEIELSA